MCWIWLSFFHPLVKFVDFSLRLKTHRREKIVKKTGSCHPPATAKNWFTSIPLTAKNRLGKLLIESIWVGVYLLLRAHGTWRCQGPKSKEERALTKWVWNSKTKRRSHLVKDRLGEVVELVVSSERTAWVETLKNLIKSSTLTFLQVRPRWTMFCCYRKLMFPGTFFR